MRDQLTYLFVTGDDMYPKDPEFNGVEYDFNEYAEKTREEFRQMSKNINRMEHLKNTLGTEIFINIIPHNGHLSPNGIESKL